MRDVEHGDILDFYKLKKIEWVMYVVCVFAQLFLCESSV